MKPGDNVFAFPIVICVSRTWQRQLPNACWNEMVHSSGGMLPPAPPSCLHNYLWKMYIRFKQCLCFVSTKVLFLVAQMLTNKKNEGKSVLSQYDIKESWVRFSFSGMHLWQWLITYTRIDVQTFITRLSKTMDWDSHNITAPTTVSANCMCYTCSLG